MKTGETARKVYEIMHVEIVERVRLRDSILIIYLGGVGTVFGLALGAIAKQEVLLILPYLAIGVAAIISHHHSILGAQMAFIVDELVPFFKSIKDDTPIWEISKTRKKYSGRDITLRFAANLTLICIPPIVGLLLTYNLGFYSPFPLGPLWWAGVLITILAICTIAESHIYRKKLLDKTMWDHNKTFDV